MTSEGFAEDRYAERATVPEGDQSQAREANRDSFSRAEQGAVREAEQGGVREAEQGGVREAEQGGVREAEQGGVRERERVDLTDPKAMRALAHPLRWALLEALAQAGTLTATQASEMLGESPANCAFHLRTLAKYGFVEEAGGGRGRERPWRRTYDTLSWRIDPDDPGVTIAAEALDQVWVDRLLNRARRSLTSTASWPRDLENALGTSSSRLYVRPAEARRLYAAISEAFNQLHQDPEIAARRYPDHRPADALPVEFVLLGYPVLDSPPLPADGGADDDEAAVADDANDDDADRMAPAPEGVPAPVPGPPKMSDPRDTMGGAR